MAAKRLTKEGFSSLFHDDFQLTSHAIELAKEQIQAGNEDLNVSEMLEEMIRRAQKNVPPASPAVVEDDDAQQE